MIAPDYVEAVLFTAGGFRSHMSTKFQVEKVAKFWGGMVLTLACQYACTSRKWAVQLKVAKMTHFIICYVYNYIHNFLKRQTEETSLSFPKWTCTSGSRPCLLMFFYRTMKRVEKKKKKKEWRGWNSLEVQWLGLCAFTGFHWHGRDSIPSWGTKTL